MKCPKCGYNSFDHLDNCKKCDTDLTGHKEKFQLHGFYSPGQTAPAAPVSEGVTETAPDDDGSVDFGFDFLEEEEGAETPADGQNVSIDQPFGADSENIPADDSSNDDDDKPGKGPEFAF